MKKHGIGMTYLHDVPEKWEVVNDEYVDTTRSVYQMWVNDVVVFLVSVVNADPHLQIFIGRPDAEDTGVWHGSVGQAFRGTHEVGGTPTSPGDLVEHVDGVSVQRYVYPRIPQILTHMYVPKLAAGTAVPDSPAGLE